MEGKNKKIEQEIPAALAQPKNSIDARRFSFMSPSNLPLAPRSFHVWQKPYFMNQVGAAGASSSTGTRNCFLQGSYPFSMGAENNKKTDQNPFPPSDQKLTLETSAGDNSATTEVGNGVQVRRGRNLDYNMDPKKLKRVISNRLSAQKSRMKKFQYVCDMERKVESLQTLIAVLSSQVALQKNKKDLLQMEQKNLNERITAYANHQIIVEAEIEERRAEVNRLRQLYLTQQQQKMQAQTSWGVWDHGLVEQMVNPCLNQSVPGQPMYVNSNQVGAGENAAEIKMLNQLYLQQEKSGHILVPGWEPGHGQLTDVGLDQSGLMAQVQNPSFDQSKQQEGSLNSNMGELGQILNIHFGNQNPGNDFV